MYTGRFQPPSRQIVTYGTPVAEALPAILREFWVGQAVLATNTSLSVPGALGPQVSAALGKACCNEVTGIRANSPREDVLRLTGALRNKGMEALVAVGGGSVVEAAKAARICLTNNIGTVKDFARLRQATTAAPPRPYLFSIPTTLSAAEYTQFAGITDLATGVKDAYHHPDLAPDVVILDPEATMQTPMDLWLSTGMRAIDHAVETWCASDGSSPYADSTSLHALRLLARALPASHADPEDRRARLDCLTGAWMSIQGATVGVPHGASHGIGHALSAVTGMTHGVTSCIMLPHVLRYNATINAARQDALAGAMGQAGRPLADAVADLVERIGQPRRLRDAGVRRGQLGRIAELALDNPRVRANPRPFAGKPAMLAMLDAAY